MEPSSALVARLRLPAVCRGVRGDHVLRHSRDLRVHAQAYELRVLRAPGTARCNRWRGASAPPGRGSAAAAAASGSRSFFLRASAATTANRRYALVSAREAGSAWAPRKAPYQGQPWRYRRTRGLTPRSSRGATASHAARAAHLAIMRRTGGASCRSARLSSNVRPRNTPSAARAYPM